MLKNRIIPCLDIKDGRTVKGVNFFDLKDAGDPIALAKLYSDAGADELVFLDISASVEKRKTLVDLVEKVAAEISIPFTVGGGIGSVADAKAVLNAGADKVSLNSAALKHPQLITEVAETCGQQCVVVAIDTKCEAGEHWVYRMGGRQKTSYKTLDWAREAERLGAGEILLTAMGQDGTKSGFDLAITQAVCQAVRLPVIASGGAGTSQDFVDLFQQTEATAGLAASIFHYGQLPISTLKTALKTYNIAIR